MARSSRTASRRLGALCAAVLLGCGGAVPVGTPDVPVADVPVGSDLGPDVALDGSALDASMTDARDGSALDAPRLDAPTDVAGDLAPEAGACTASGAYPAGPYGTAVGSVVEDFAWRGLATPAGTTEPSTGPLAALQLSEIRPTGCRYAIVHMATPG